MMEFLDFARGPLFKFSFAIMILGLLRIVLLALYGMGEAMIKAGDKTVDYKDLLKKTLSWLFPITSWAGKKPVYSIISILFHIGLILVPIFLAAHVTLWKQGAGVSWPAMPQFLADLFTLFVIIGGPALFIARVASRPARAISRFQDYVWPLLLTVPALSGFICVNLTLSPNAYQSWMVVHVLAANLILILMPFTKMAHCILMPVTQFVSGVGWKFPVGAGDKAAGVLGKRGQAV